MREIINYIMSCFCRHNWEEVKIIRSYWDKDSKLPHKVTGVYLCKKCGTFKRIEF